MAEPVLKLAPSLKPPKPRAATLTDALRKRMRFILLVVLPVIAVVTGLVLYMMGGRYVSTDDAYVHAAKLMVSTDVSGLVSEVDVHEGQTVKAGDVLFRVDPRQFQIALDNAKANMAQTALSLQAMKEDYGRMQQDIAAAAVAGRSGSDHVRSRCAALKDQRRRPIHLRPGPLHP